MIWLIPFTSTVQVSGVSPAAGLKSGRSNRRRKLNGINIQFSDRINMMDRINILNQKNPDNPVNPVEINEASYKVSGVKTRELA